MNFEGGCQKRYRIEYIEPGIVNYEDEEQGKVFVSYDALNRMMPSFIGKPVVNLIHRALTYEQAFKLTDEERESLADGIIFNSGKLDNGRFYADAIVWDLDTQENIDKKGFSASCAYVPTEVGGEGKCHFVPYDEEVIDGRYTHMAIVNNPRYEFAKIYELPKEYRNSVSDEMIQRYQNLKKEKTKMAGKTIFKIFGFGEKKNSTEKPEEKKTEDKVENLNANDSMVDVGGEQIPLSTLIECYLAEQAEIAKKEELEKQAAAKGEKKEVALNPDDKVKINDKEVAVGELAACYGRQNAKKNGVDGGAPNEKEIPGAITAKDTELKNSIKEKSANFEIIKNAVANGKDGVRVELVTTQQRYDLGKERYGSKKEVK
jgi:hypothetical protein